MKLKIAPQKIIRFDFNKNFANKDYINFDERILIRYETGKLQNGDKWIGIRWSINFNDKETGEEIFGHLSEMRAFYEIENREKDKIDLENFINTSFVNIEFYFQEHAPKKYAHTNLTQPDSKNAAEEFIALIENEYNTDK